MRALALLAGIAISVSTPPALAQDSRIQTVDYRDDAVFDVAVASGYQVIILLSANERIQTVSLGDNSGWQANTSSSGNEIFVRLLDSSFPTNMAVNTNLRRYNFELIPIPEGSPPAAYVLQFNYPLTAGLASSGDLVPLRQNYRFKGKEVLRPILMGDDGQKTYIQWHEDTDIPAVYAVNDAGDEVLVDGQMRGDQYVIDRVVRELVFRVDKLVARAIYEEERQR